MAIIKEFFSCHAGKVKYDDTTGEAIPQPCPGRLALRESSEDPSLRAIIWMPRNGNTTEQPSQELMVLPGDVEFTPVPQCKTGRVISMKFLSSSQKYFFWLQSPVPEDSDLNIFSADDERILSELTELANEELEELEEDEDEEEEEEEDDDEEEEMLMLDTDAPQEGH